jgi:Viral BACON domain/Putative binding domain, N-terminal
MASKLLLDMMEASMRRQYGRIGVGAALAVLATIWACSEKSPTGPTPPAACVFTLSAASLTFGSGGGSASINVATAAGCQWTATSDRGWMTIGNGASGAGPGTVAVAVTANANTNVRTGVLTIAGQAVNVTQDGAVVVPCTISLTPASANFSKDAANGSFAVTAPSTCTWTAASDAGWVTVAGGASGQGNGTVNYSVARNTVLDVRIGAIHVADASFAITQAGDLGGCEYRVAPVEISACMAVPYELSTTVTTQAACAWTATPDAPWISLVGGSSRTGSGEVRFRVSDNYDPPRLGVLKLRWDTPTAGQNVRVSQAGCRYAVTVTTIAVPAAGGSRTFDVYQQSDPIECGGPLQSGCVWSAEPGAAWISITTPMPRAGDDRVTFTVAPNHGVQRSATIAVRDETVLVVQSGS